MTEGPQDWQPTPHDYPDYGTQPGYAVSAPPVDHPNGTLVFVLGVLSVVGLSILGPFAWVVGRRVVREIDANPHAYRNRGLALTGMVLGIVGTCLLALGVVALVTVVAVLVGTRPR